MVVHGTVEEWPEWTGLPFDKTGRAVVPRALAPVHCDVEHGTATYVEPNVWVVDRTGAQAVVEDLPEERLASAEGATGPDRERDPAADSDRREGSRDPVVQQDRRRHRACERGQVRNDVVDRRDETPVDHVGGGDEQSARERHREQESDHGVILLDAAENR
jgi:hypothetical protein